jgi:hypothetical protein
MLADALALIVRANEPHHAAHRRTLRPPTRTVQTAERQQHATRPPSRASAPLTTHVGLSSRRPSQRGPKSAPTHGLASNQPSARRWVRQSGAVRP